ncbi:MAG: hypothetical protein QOD71_147 [Thermoleophilaceae bacterium]|jgi:hypothetical protein|nr:hypothetical protein [Thermoleophilaceae bacterium]
MTSLRFPLLAAVLLAGFVWAAVAVAQAPVEWYRDTGAGGALAQPAGESKSGGALAPRTATGEADVPESDISATPPVASPAQAEPVLGAPGEERSAPARAPVAHAAQEAPTVTGGEDQPNSGAGLIGSLPLTGLELAGLVGAGLVLVLAGAALRPRRRVAEPR